MTSLKNRIVTFLFVVAGLCLINYPFLSEWVNSFHQAEVLSTYDEAIATKSEEELNGYIADAMQYNEGLLESNVTLNDAFSSGGSTDETYLSLLSLSPDGVMGTIEIPSIHVTLPIYHGTSSKVLEEGAGHLEGSSLPVGGTGSHAVLSAHSGLPEKRLFSDIDQLAVGDHFKLLVYGLKLEYEVDDIRVVEPWNTSYLSIQPDKDMVTLVTCTPYGINSHRLFVSGHRTEWTDTEVVTSEESAGMHIGIREIQIGILAISAVVLLVSGKMLLFSRRRNKK